MLPETAFALDFLSAAVVAAAAVGVLRAVDLAKTAVAVAVPLAVFANSNRT